MSDTITDPGPEAKFYALSLYRGYRPTYCPWHAMGKVAAHFAESTARCVLMFGGEARSTEASARTFLAAERYASVITERSSSARDSARAWLGGEVYCPACHY